VVVVIPLASRKLVFFLDSGTAKEQALSRQHSAFSLVHSYRFEAEC
jgi:hypothetical protein